MPALLPAWPTLAAFLAASLLLAITPGPGVFYIVTRSLAQGRRSGLVSVLAIGIRMWRTPGEPIAGAPAEPLPAARIFRDGLLVSLLNPKTTIFFAAFLPQFTGDTPSPIRQSLALGLLFVLVALCTDSLYALGAGTVSRCFARGGTPRFGRRLGGSLFIGLGLFTALAGARGPGR